MTPTLSDPGNAPGRREDHDPRTGFHPRDRHDALRPDAPPETLTAPAPETPFATLVVGLDGSPQSRGALRWAVTEARTRGAAVDVVPLADDDGWLDEAI